MSQSSLFWIWWDARVWGNAMSAYVLALVFFVLCVLVLILVQRFFLARFQRYSKRSKTPIDDIVVRILESLRPPLPIFLSAYTALQTLSMSDFFRTALNSALILFVTYQVARTLHTILDMLIERSLRGKTDAHARVAMTLIGTLLRGVIWVFAVLLIISNLGVNVTSLLAGVGIGGIAIAFALQNILKDVFSSFSLFLDKPFTVGDFVVIGQHSGTVKEIGVKTTRIKSLGGEEVIIPNSELTTSRIENFKKMKRRRVCKKFGVVYGTSNEKLQRIPEMLQSITETIDQVTFGRAHFKNFGDSGLIFEYVYFVETSDYEIYMDIRQAFNLRMKEVFEREGIEFAYPTMKIVK